MNIDPKIEIWQKFADETGGHLTIEPRWQTPKLVIDFAHWQLTFDIYITEGVHGNTLTRVRVPFINQRKFYFSLYHQDIFSEIGKLLGMQDIEIDYPEFDNSFVIKSNDKTTIKALLVRREICQLLLANPDLCFEIRDDEGYRGPTFPPTIDELYLYAVEVVADITRLRTFFQLCCQTLTQLSLIGVASEELTNFTL